MNDLSTYFTDLADEAPHDLGLLSRVQARTTRRTRVRRLCTAVAAAATAAAVVVGGVTLLPNDEGESLRYTDSPASFFEEGNSDLTVPFGVSGLLPGLANPPRVEVDPAGSTRLTYLPASGGPGGNLSVITGQKDTGLDGELVQVRGRPGQLRCAELLCELSWQEQPRLFVLLQRETGSAQGDARAEVLQAAAGLRHINTTFVNQLTVRLSPTGCARDWRDLGQLELTGPADRCAVAVHLAPAGGFDGEPVSVGGRTGVRAVAELGQQRYLLRAVSGRAIDLSVPTAWSDELVESFVAAITVAGE